MTGDWRAAAACLNTPVDVFYPTSTDALEAAPAKAICWDCPVRRDCLAEALACREHHGVWGGLTINERRRVAQALRWDRQLAVNVADELANPVRARVASRRCAPADGRT